MAGKPENSVLVSIILHQRVAACWRYTAIIELTATSLLCRYGMSKGGHSSLVFIRNASFSVWWSDFPSTPSNMALFWLCTFSVTTPKKRSAAMADAGT